MVSNLKKLARNYRAALQKYPRQSAPAGLFPATGLGCQAAALDLETLDMAKIHEAALIALTAGSNRVVNRQRADLFFTEAIVPIEKTHRAALKASAHLRQLDQRLGRQTADLVVSHKVLKTGIIHRKTVEQALQTSGRYYAGLVQESRCLQAELRRLTHQILLAQEAERKKISRKLHDEVAQTLLGINVRLLTLKKEAKVNMVSLKKEIASTQRLVGKSAQTMSRFTREIGQRHDT